MPFYAYHQSIESSMHPASAHLQNRGKIVEVAVIHENGKIAHVRDVNTGDAFTVAKWPLNYWGKVRGVFTKREDAQSCIESAPARFDHDGHIINKISKSDS